jgi:hypothetical protein
MSCTSLLHFPFVVQAVVSEVEAETTVVSVSERVTHAVADDLADAVTEQAGGSAIYSS